MHRVLYRYIFAYINMGVKLCQKIYIHHIYQRRIDSRRWQAICDYTYHNILERIGHKPGDYQWILHP